MLSRGVRPRRLPTLPRWARIALLLGPALLVVAVFFVGGVAQAVAQSLGFQPYVRGHSPSLDAYRRLWQDPAIRASLLLTGRVALLSTALSAVLGVTAALLIRGLTRTRAVVTRLVQTTLAVPHLVGALAILLLLSQGGLASRVTHAIGLTSTPAAFPALTNDRFGWGIVAELVWKETPFLTVIALAVLAGGVADLENAARTLQASRWQRLRHVTLPVLAPPVAAGSVLVFAFATGSYEVPYLLGQPYPATLAVVAYQDYRDPDLTARPAAMAVAVLITVLTVVTVMAYLAVTSRLSRRSL